MYKIIWLFRQICLKKIIHLRAINLNQDSFSPSFSLFFFAMDEAYGSFQYSLFLKKINLMPLSTRDQK